MKERRSRHGSCAVANYVYVACGWSDKHLQSIERINMDAIDDGWEELLVSSSENLSPRDSIFMEAISRDELVIIGGNGKNDCRADGYILDIPKMCLKTINKNTPKFLKCVAFKNLSIKISDRKVACLTFYNEIVVFDRVNCKTSIMAQLH